MADDPVSHRLERLVRWTLLSGLCCSGLLLAVGLAVALTSGQARPVGRPPSVRVLMEDAVRGEGVALLDLGLLALMATPVLRVAALTVGWGVAREFRFAAVAAAVLGLLMVSIALGTG